jgi:hypothetical protein
LQDAGYWTAIEITAFQFLQPPKLQIDTGQGNARLKPGEQREVIATSWLLQGSFFEDYGRRFML